MIPNDVKCIQKWWQIMPDGDNCYVIMSSGIKWCQMSNVKCYKIMTTGPKLCQILQNNIKCYRIMPDVLLEDMLSLIINHWLKEI